jgi:hypothetical protein
MVTTKFGRSEYLRNRNRKFYVIYVYIERESYEQHCGIMGWELGVHTGVKR